MKISFKLILVAYLSLISLLIACDKDRNNTQYKPLYDEVLSCKPYNVKTREEQYDQGVMTPIDGKFLLFSCSIINQKDKHIRKKIETVDQKIINGVIRTKDFGPIYITFHGPSSSGLYDGVVKNSWGYSAINMQHLLYMTDYQVYEIQKFLEE